MEGKFNPVEKNLDVYLYGIPEEIIKDINYIDDTMCNAIKLSNAHTKNKIVEKIGEGCSGVYLLLESEAAFHATPETNPNFMSFKISTCGNNTHPILALKYILERINPIGGKICYYKEGLDIVNRSSIFPKTISSIIDKYKKQFYVKNFKFEPSQVKQFEYDFFFYDIEKITKKIASILGVKIPLEKEVKIESLA